LLVKPPKGKENFLLDLITNRVSPGVDPAAKVKAEFLAEIVTGKKKSPLIDPLAAIKLLSTMIGGYNVAPLVTALKDKKLAAPTVLVDVIDPPSFEILERMIQSIEQKFQ